MPARARLRALPPAALLLALSVLGGCASDQQLSLYAPRSTYTLSSDIQQMHAAFGSAASITEYYKTTPETQARRDEFIAARLSLYNLEYLKFVSDYRLTKAQEASIFDLTSTGVNLATAVTGSAATKTILAAVATALTSTRTSLDKNFYDQETTSALITAMNAQRKAALLPILAGMKNPPSQYPLSSAIVDLDAYQQAGTIEGALEAVQADASTKDAAAQAQIDQYRTYSFAPDDSTQKLNQWIWPGLASFNHDTGAALDANGATIAASQTNLAALRKYLDAHNLSGLQIASFLDNGKLAPDRADAVKALIAPPAVPAP